MAVGTYVTKLALSKLPKVCAVLGVPLLARRVSAIISVITDFVFMLIVTLSSKLTEALMIKLANRHPFWPG